MFKRVLVFFVVAHISIGSAAADLPAVARRLEPSVVHIATTFEHRSRAGSGFVVSREGHIVTNFHVIELHVKSGWPLTVWMKGDPPAKRRPAKLVKSFPGLDLAIIKVARKNTQPIRLSDSGGDRPAKGAAIFALGFPAVGAALGGEKEASIVSGIVSRRFLGSWSPTGPKFRIIQHTAPSNPGNSGGPVINACGQIVGVNTRREIAYVVLPGGLPVMTDTIQGVFYASHVTVLIPKLKEAGIQAVTTRKRCRVFLGIATTNLWLWGAVMGGLALALIFFGMWLFRSGRSRSRIILVLMVNVFHGGARRLGRVFQRR